MEQPRAARRRAGASWADGRAARRRHRATWRTAPRRGRGRARRRAGRGAGRAGPGRRRRPGRAPRAEYEQLRQRPRRRRRRPPGRRGSCSGCHLTLSAVEVDRIREAPARRRRALRGVRPPPRPTERAACCLWFVGLASAGRAGRCSGARRSTSGSSWLGVAAAAARRGSSAAPRVLHTRVGVASALLAW